MFLSFFGVDPRQLYCLRYRAMTGYVWTDAEPLKRSSPFLFFHRHEVESDKEGEYSFPRLSLSLPRHLFFWTAPWTTKSPRGLEGAFASVVQTSHETLFFCLGRISNDRRRRRRYLRLEMTLLFGCHTQPRVLRRSPVEMSTTLTTDDVDGLLSMNPCRFDEKIRYNK